MSVSDSTFAIALCQAGAERWLKAEIARIRPDLRAAFQRPGLVTFKTTDRPFSAEDAPPAVFARAWACSAGPVEGVPGTLAVARRLGARWLFVSPRDAGPPGDVPAAVLAEHERHATAIEAELRASGAFQTGAPRTGELVLDVIAHPGDPLVVGWHVAAPRRHQGPGGRLDYPAPEVLPSRAWRKIVEGLMWSGAPVKAGDKVLEIGAAPGGSTRALAERGAEVIAIDPLPLDPTVLAMPSVRWIGRAIGDIKFESLPPDVTWIATDINLPPLEQLPGLRRLVGRYHKTLQGLLLMIKLADDEAAESLPLFFDQLRELGARTVRARQLPANRKDLFVYAAWR